MRGIRRTVAEVENQKKVKKRGKRGLEDKAKEAKDPAAGFVPGPIRLP